MYTKFYSKFWDDEKVLQLSFDAKALMVYMYTNKHRNVIGCYVLPKAYALEDIRMPEDRFIRAWDEVISSGMVVYEEDTRLLLLKNFLRHNPIENPNQVKGAISKLNGLPRSQLFIMVYQFLKCQVGKDYLNPLLVALSKLFTDHEDQQLMFAQGLHSETLPETVAETLSEPLQKQVYSKSISKSKQYKNEYSHKSTAADVLPAGFHEFWELYPKKVNKQNAVKAWSQVEAANHIETILSVLAMFVSSPDWLKNGGQFIPYPASWLRGRRWEDETKPGTQGGNILEELFREELEAQNNDTS